MQSRPQPTPPHEPDAASPDGVSPGAATPQATFRSRDGQTVQEIRGAQNLAPFLMTVASDTDLWMYVASGGGLTCGRVDASGALFPYETVDRLHDAHHHTGPITLLRVEREGAAPVLWQPFAADGGDHPARERRLARNVAGSQQEFLEIAADLGLVFRYRWAACDRFGWVRTATLENRGTGPVRVAVLDGLRNLLPPGAPLGLYQQASNLVDAYKTAEVDPDTGLGIYALSAGITDRAEALESLRATTVWQCGLEGARVHLDLAAVDAFQRGQVLPGARTLVGGRGHYLVSAHLEVAPGAQARWHLAADTGSDQVQVTEQRRWLLAAGDPGAEVEASLAAATANLERLVASADGAQRTGRPEAWAHHFANVLFNVMRGGVFLRDHDIPREDFAAFLRERNVDVADRHAGRVAAWPEVMSVAELRAAARDTGDADLARLAHEYLPLFFGRRHGDPSRPWNRFAIRLRDRTGERMLSYEGNWRDIFQNWEALARSFPGFLPSMVAKFVNASTVDGHNPYRLTREGIDWEVEEPEDPWSNIGYWGDHQVIYLLKLLEALRDHDPGALVAMLGEPIFSYADVPYRLKPYAELLQDPQRTIVFDHDRADRAAARAARLGADGKLVPGPDGGVHHATLLEKLLVTTLAKLSNLVPGGGIWMNTQRPEWNDANNALAGGGLSVVTLAHLRRWLAFLLHLLEPRGGQTVPVAGEVARWCEAIAGVLREHVHLLEGGSPGGRALDDLARRRVLDGLGEAFTAYRETVYADGFTAPVQELTLARVVELCRTALRWVDHGLRASRRADGLYHGYNLLVASREGEGLSVRHLDQMLEGQVALLSSGALTPTAALALLEQLFASDLYDPDRKSFVLYPVRPRPGFLARNVVDAEAAGRVPLLQRMLAEDDRTLVARDAEGTVRFAGDLGNARDVEAVLDQLAARPGLADAVARDRDAVLALYEDTFGHRAYLGRAGVMYGYEGIGCIYWHMVAKLLLAVQEVHQQAVREAAPAAVREGLAAMYFRVRAGIGYEKTVAEYGAFPTEPYSHTPADGVARQPGMTGQVKEEILTRFGELGVTVEDGALRFRPSLLQASELLDRPAAFPCPASEAPERVVELPAGSLGFTVCAVPVVYVAGPGAARIQATLTDGTETEIMGDRLPPELSSAVLGRTGTVARLTVSVPRERLREE